MNNLIHATYKTYPTDVPKDQSQIMILTTNNKSIAPFLFFHTPEHTIYTYESLKSTDPQSTKLDGSEFFEWCYFYDLLPQILQ